jgi:hypothetical protein
VPDNWFKEFFSEGVMFSWLNSQLSSDSRENWLFTGGGGGE